MKKPRKAKMTWDDLLKIEDKYPFSAGNPRGSFSLPAHKPKRRICGQLNWEFDRQFKSHPV
jgi:hypothetical protein